MTRAKYLLIVLVAFTVGCSKASTTAPSTAAPNSFSFTATILPANEVPPISNAEQSGRGTATIGFVVTKDAGGTITAATITYAVTLTGFPAGMNLTQAHIHAAVAGVSGGIVVQTSLANGEVVIAADGTGSFNKSFAAPADITQQIINNPGNFYFNVHTSANPGGVARGQLVKN